MVHLIKENLQPCLTASSSALHESLYRIVFQVHCFALVQTGLLKCITICRRTDYYVRGGCQPLCLCIMETVLSLQALIGTEFREGDS